MRHWIGTFGLLALLASVAPQAVAGAPRTGRWAAPVETGAAGVDLIGPSLAFRPDGSAVLGWLSQTPADFDANAPLSLHLASVTPGGPPIEEPVAAAQDAALPFVTGRGEVIVLRAPTRGTLTASVDGGAPQTLATGVAAFATAADARGDAAVVVATRGSRTDRGRLLLTVRPGSPGAAFSPARTIATGRGLDRPGALALAVGPEGEAVVAMVRDRRLEIRSGSLTGRFGRAQRLARTLGDDDLDVAVGPRGRAVVALVTQDGGEEANVPFVVRAALRDARSAPFGPARVLDRARELDRPYSPAYALVAADGVATVAWSGLDGGRFARSLTVRAATALAHHGFGHARLLTRNAALESLVAAPDGRVLLVADRYPTSARLTAPGQVLAAIKPSRATAFGALEAVSAPEVVFDATGAFDPRTGRPAVAWARGHDGGGGTERTIKLALRAR